MFFHGYEGGEVRMLHMRDVSPGEEGLSLGYLFMALFYNPTTGVRPGRIFYFPPGVDPPRLREVVDEEHVAKIIALYRPGVPVTFYIEAAHPKHHILGLLEDLESEVDNGSFDGGGETDSDEN